MGRPTIDFDRRRRRFTAPQWYFAVSSGDVRDKQQPALDFDYRSQRVTIQCAGARSTHAAADMNWRRDQTSGSLEISNIPSKIVLSTAQHSSSRHRGDQNLKDSVVDRVGSREFKKPRRLHYGR